MPLQAQIMINLQEFRHEITRGRRKDQEFRPEARAGIINAVAARTTRRSVAAVFRYRPSTMTDQL